jgi:hypothetical protein
MFIWLGASDFLGAIAWWNSNCRRGAASGERLLRHSIYKFGHAESGRFVEEKEVFDKGKDLGDRFRVMPLLDLNLQEGMAGLQNLRRAQQHVLFMPFGVDLYDFHRATTPQPFEIIVK